MPEPLPELISLEAFHGNWEVYLDAIYDIYISTLVNAHLSFEGIRIGYRYLPPTDGKGFGFWHLISEGAEEEKRYPDLSRCERIRWISWVITHYDTNPDIVWYGNERNHNSNIVIWHKSQNYLVILGKRTDYYLLLSAYIANGHKSHKLDSEWRAYWGKG